MSSAQPASRADGPLPYSKSKISGKRIWISEPGLRSSSAGISFAAFAAIEAIALHHNAVDGFAVWPVGRLQIILDSEQRDARHTRLQEYKIARQCSRLTRRRAERKSRSSVAPIPQISAARRTPPPNVASGISPNLASFPVRFAAIRRGETKLRISRRGLQSSTRLSRWPGEIKSCSSCFVLDGDLISIANSGAPNRSSSALRQSHRSGATAATSAARRSHSAIARKGISISTGKPGSIVQEAPHPRLQADVPHFRTAHLHHLAMMQFI